MPEGGDGPAELIAACGTTLKQAVLVPRGGEDLSHRVLRATGACRIRTHGKVVDVAPLSATSPEPSDLVSAEDNQEGRSNPVPPENEVPVAVAVNAALGRTDEVAVCVVGMQVFSTGVRFEVAIRLRSRLAVRLTTRFTS